MKIVLTMSEVKDLLLRSYDLPKDVEVEVISNTPPAMHPDAVELEKLFSREQFIDPDIKSIILEKRIPAIKLMRSVLDMKHKECSLVVAKSAIDDWPNFFAYLCKNGYPDMSLAPSETWAKK